MRLEIKYKLLILIILPVITIIFFSTLHLYDKYTKLEENENLFTYAKIIKKSSNLIYALQIERSATHNYLNNKDTFHAKQLKERMAQTDIYINEFKRYTSQIDRDILSQTNIEYINKLDSYLSNLQKIRKKILLKKASKKHSFTIYTEITKHLTGLVQSFKFHSNDVAIFEDTLMLKNLLILQELAYQEKSLVSDIIDDIDANIYDTQKIQHFNKLLSAQKEQYRDMVHIIADPQIKYPLIRMHAKYQNSWLSKTRSQIRAYESKKNLLHQTLQEYLQVLNTNAKSIDKEKILSLYQELKTEKNEINKQQWLNSAAQRIKDIHQLETLVLSIITKNTNLSKKETLDNMTFLLLLTLFTVFSLLLGARYIYLGIHHSISQLSYGVEEFFDFLNFKKEKPLPIETNSNDEISDIAEGFNKQIQLVQENLEEDKHFINETTQIVTLMKDGVFSERLYFDPHNPNLKELKVVFNELIDLISDKIKEQTLELEHLNASLSDEVYYQTIELQRKVNELTIARDKAIQAEVAKDEFLANMSHEIRTPLNAILGFVSILKKRIDDEKSLSYLSIIDGSGQSLLTIINDILDFSKIQSGKFSINPHNINPLEEFSNVVLLFASKAYEKHLNYIVYIDPKLPKTISVDAVRVKQIISNLLSNAIKFSKEDGIIKVKILCQNATLSISVQDTGIGISKENQSKIFSAFEQADGSTTRKYGGTGLGLSISSKLTELMKGTLSLKSQKNVGSTFTCSIPVEVIQSEPLETMSLTAIKDVKCAILSNSLGDSFDTTRVIKKYLCDFGLENIIELSEYEENGYDILFFVPDDEYNEEVVSGKTPAVAILRSASIKLANLEHIQPLYAPFVPMSIIQAINDLGIKNVKKPSFHKEQTEQNEVQFRGNILVAEDNKTNQMLISLLLDDYGINYTIANNGLEAVSLFKQNSFDLVLMDENMPKLNGIGAMQQIKAYEKENSLLHTPIIALTASVLDSDKEMFTKAGMDGFVGKPINNKELEAELGKYLQKQ